MRKKSKASVFFSPARKKALKAGFRSGLEQRVSNELHSANVTHDYEPSDRKLPYYLKSKAHCAVCGSNDTLERHEYIIDFYIHKTNIVLETKGKFDRPMALKMLAVRDYNPEYEIVMLFMSNGKIGRGRYSDWCEKNGIKYFFESDTDKWISYIKGK